MNDVGISLNKITLDDGGIERLESYRQRDPRVKFLSAFPVSVLISNEIQVSPKMTTWGVPRVLISGGLQLTMQATIRWSVAMVDSRWVAPLNAALSFADTVFALRR